jgi:hypothetical protein
MAACNVRVSGHSLSAARNGCDEPVLFVARVHSGFYSLGLVTATKRVHHHESGVASMAAAAVTNALARIPAGVVCVTNDRTAFNAFDRRPAHMILLQKDEVVGETDEVSQSAGVLVAYATVLSKRHPWVYRFRV